MDHTSPSGPGLASMKASGAAKSGEASMKASGAAKSGVRHSRVTVGS